MNAKKKKMSQCFKKEWKTASVILQLQLNSVKPHTHWQDYSCIHTKLLCWFTSFLFVSFLYCIGLFKDGCVCSDIHCFWLTFFFFNIILRMLNSSFAAFMTFLRCQARIWMSYKHFFFSLVPSQALLKPAAPAFLDSPGRLDPEELRVQLVSKASEVHALTWLVSVSTRSNIRLS